VNLSSIQCKYLSGIVQAELDSAAHDAIEPSPKRVKSEEDAFTETITIDWGDENVKVLYAPPRCLPFECII